MLSLFPGMMPKSVRGFRTTSCSYSLNCEQDLRFQADAPEIILFEAHAGCIRCCGWCAGAGPRTACRPWLSAG
ncbi:hypothetical protein E0H33_30895 [Rhizobium leguminosarum bv. viciae]|nr:hypothetical protein E0H33_30895 [Rhizobium leguminosarum bv. viciae]